MDVVCHNRYFGWYQDTGFTGGIEESLSQIIESWYTFQNKPILITEYGASAIAGLHKVGVALSGCGMHCVAQLI